MESIAGQKNQSRRDELHNLFKNIVIQLIR